jgi:hypothetical protein
MLYIDQPVGTGFSYVSLVNGTMNLLDSKFTALASENDLPQLNATTVQATLDAKDPATLPRTTMSAARTMWMFAQVWFNEYVLCDPDF